MIGYALWAAASFGCALSVCATFLFGVRPALDHRRHARTLANIARLETELGYDVPLEVRIDRELQRTNLANYNTLLAREAWYPRSSSYSDGDPPEPTERIYGDCAVCGKHVVVNAGKCRGATTRGTEECAKLSWLRTAK